MLERQDSTETMYKSLFSFDLSVPTA